jgi:hypothetical protein
MTQDYPKPIAPPPELVQQWLNADAEKGLFAEPLAAKAAQWGADQELEACCEEMKSLPSPLGIPFGEMASNALRSARRPKPPSLKKQALQELEQLRGDANSMGMGFDAPAIRRALEQLDD